VKRILACVALLFWFGGCDLEEAQRMHLTGSQVDSIDAQTPTIVRQDGKAIGVSSFFKSSFVTGWNVNWNDEGTHCHGTSWRFFVRDGDTLVWRLRSNGKQDSAPYLGSWIERIPSLTCALEWTNSAGDTQTTLQTCPFYKDFNDLSWDASQEAMRTVRTGDTVSIVFSLGNAVAGAGTYVTSDHAGLRIVGNYVDTLAPGQSGSLRWVVLATAGGIAWVDLHWGPFDQVHRFRFRVVS